MEMGRRGGGRREKETSATEQLACIFIQAMQHGSYTKAVGEEEIDCGERELSFQVCLDHPPVFNL